MAIMTADPGESRPWQNQLGADRDAWIIRASHGRGVLAEVPGDWLRGLLIALALEPGHVIPKATLVDWIWGVTNEEADVVRDG